MRIPSLLREIHPSIFLPYISAGAVFAVILLLATRSPVAHVSTDVASSTIPNIASGTWPAHLVSAESSAAVAESIAAKEDVDSDQALENAAVSLRKALVNIFCFTTSSGGLRSISGSGVFIDSNGIILTNAHVGQYFLLSPRSTSCVVRSGTPARKQYIAKLLYISPRWVTENPNVITAMQANGTGEHDFALLGVIDTATTTPLPNVFPAVRLAGDPPHLGARVAVATYGGQFLTDEQLRRALYPTVVFGTVKDFFTFDHSTVDLIQLGGSAAAQEGSSGGGVADANGALVGTITTSSDGSDVNSRFLGALTAAYIRGAYATETGKPLETLLTRPIATSVEEFAQRIPELVARLSPTLRE